MKEYIKRFKEWIYEYNIDSFFAGIAFAMALGFIFYEWNNDWVARIDVIISVTAGLLIGLSLSYMLSYTINEEDEE
tara:strand:- start:403 stop:630 length:228 start_codon:yes stop_codon:yes gene_type:complete